MNTVFMTRRAVLQLLQTGTAFTKCLKISLQMKLHVHSRISYRSHTLPTLKEFQPQLHKQQNMMGNYRCAEYSNLCSARFEQWVKEWVHIQLNTVIWPKYDLWTWSLALPRQTCISVSEWNGQRGSIVSCITVSNFLPSSSCAIKKLLTHSA